MIELFIEEDQYRRIAIKESGVLSECYFEDKNQEVRSGDIFLGIIRKKVKALHSVFIDIGLKKNAFLYVTDNNNFQDYKEGQSILVEVIKEEEGSKGTKVTDKISLGGRFVVFFQGKGIGYSKRLDREKFLEKQGNQNTKEGFRILFRSAAMDADREELEKEIDEIHTAFTDILKKAETGMGPKRLYGESSILDRILRDRFSEINMIYVDTRETADRLKSEYGLPSLVHGTGRSLFDFYGIEQELLKLRHRKVHLKDGGNLVIEVTEAMVVIDINSAKYTGMKNKEDMALAMNLSAVEEIARQIRLRNLSGIILVDFIDMSSEINRKKLQEAMQEKLQEDPLFSRCYPLTELNLMQMTRKKKGYPVYHFIEEECGSCDHKGKRLSYEYLRKLIKNELMKKVDNIEILDYLVVIGSPYEERVRKDISGFLNEIGAEGKRIYLEFTESGDDFRIEPLVFRNQIQEKEKYLITE
ncbi:ribonuclease E/G [Proteiniclasticum sp. C24MP]|uniref:ribonuclease E/G n=1 Tax=Proteiniclasticum sp. C24MP TaxID=3374101 RepID=UPI0037551AC7